LPAVPQVVVQPLTRAAIFLVVTINPGTTSRGVVRSLCGDLAGLVRAVGFRDIEGNLSCVMGFGSDAWDRLFGAPRPAELHPFREIKAGSRHAVSTPGDLLFHIRATRLDLCFELAQHLVDRLRGAAAVVDEVHGFRSFDERDLLGFVEGTENPEGAEALAAVQIGDEDPAFAGGSYVIVQKYVHDLEAWDALPVEQQELAMGRTKLSDLELADEVKPANSHVALNTILDEDGAQRQIMRFNMPFGRVGAGEFGTYFIGYAADPVVTEQMLRNMFIGSPPGNHDRILDFSTALTGNLFYVPTSEFLDDPSTLAGTGADEAGEPGPAQSGASDGDGSLGIGDLRGTP
jgi:porphyrinogen peroxidase